MCQKRQRRCPTLLEIRKEALKEWASAESLHEVLTCWGRLRGRTTLHRYGQRHFCKLASLQRARR